MPKSEVKVTGEKNELSAADTPGWVRMVCDRCKQRAAAADGTISWLPGVLCSCVVRQFYAGGNISACCLVVCFVSLDKLCVGISDTTTVVLSEIRSERRSAGENCKDACASEGDMQIFSQPTLENTQPGKRQTIVEFWCRIDATATL